MLNYSVILGNVGQCSDRYMTAGYGRKYEIPELFERVASIEGVTGVEYIGNWHVSDPFKKLRYFVFTPVARSHEIQNT